MKRSRDLGSFSLALLAAVIFILLGNWQLDRAGQVRDLQKPYVERPSVSLSKVAEPNSNLPGQSVNRLVEFSGRYAMQIDAPDQVDSQGERATWLVGILEVDGGGSILVVRSDEQSEMPRGDVVVAGRIFPRQFEDQIAQGNSGSDRSLRRIDPALVVSQFGGDFYDGFVVATSETVDGRSILLSRVDLDPARPGTPGYYWQHIAYVVIWWLMAAVVIFLPIYSRRRTSSESGEERT